MKKFKTFGTVEYNFVKIVEAESQEEAEAMFDNNEISVNNDELLTCVDNPELGEIYDERCPICGSYCSFKNYIYGCTTCNWESK